MLHLREHRGATGYSSGNVWHSCPLVPQSKRNKGPTYIFGWLSKGNASSLTMQQPLGSEVDTGECLDIAGMGSTTIGVDQVANQWAYYTGGEGSSSSSSKSKRQAAAAPTSQQQQLIQQQKDQETAAGHRRDHRRETKPPLHTTDSSSGFSSKAKRA